MGKLKDEMVMQLELRNYSYRTQKAYISNVKAFTRYFGKSPDRLGETEIRDYLYHLKKDKGASQSQINVAYSALKFFYAKVLNREWSLDKLPRPKKPKRLPIVLSRSEVKELLNSVKELKYRVFLMTVYSAGLRISEAANLKLSDIDSYRMQIRVEQGKGKKDRYTLLSETLLKHLRIYWRFYRPKTWLFPAKKVNLPMNVSTVQKAFKEAKKKPVLTNPLPSTL